MARENSTNNQAPKRPRWAAACGSVGLALTFAGALWGQMPPAAGAPSTAPAATIPAPSPATKVPTIAEIEALLPKNKVAIDFSGTTLAEVIAFISKNYSVTIVNPYMPKAAGESKDQETFTSKVTLKISDPVGALEALRLLDDMLLPMGFMLKEQITHDEHPEVVLRVIKTTEQARVPVFSGGDPQSIADNDELRTQVIPLVNVDPAKANEMIAPVLGPKAEVVISGINHALIVTDSGARLRTAASLIQVLERQAPDNKPHP